jgi:general stress protein 26
MATISDSEREQFFADVDAAARKAIWAAVATVDGSSPKVRMVHPTWEGDILWFATSKKSPKAIHLMANPAIDVQFQVAPPDFVHLMVAGTVEVLDDQASREHCWEVLDYDLAEFWPAGVNDPDYVAIRITPQRVELSEMFGSLNKRIWRA